MIDAATRAPLDKASVTLDPAAGSGQTDKYGEILFTLPPGAYVASAGAPTLDVGSTAVTVGTTAADGASKAVVVLPGKESVGTVRVARYELDALNLVAIHTAGKPIYTTDSCKACHSDMQGFKTSDPSTPPKLPYHALATHASKTCLFCHPSTDVSPGGWGMESGATLRKQVAVTICAGCHSNYPKQFP